ncbi:hypothetical protein [Actinomadura livida]|uniref:Uncharacterized protein n=1 Tax=Actinomadura livida TaxID=79909 RepID=A0A7W7IK00_9ACTN|nr:MULTISPECIES: hypothetical protein [Actinomadura]MBB4778532.1 hypothetical protein [Actinomadura catellatispora]GGU38038.1 hypothetical protein GCM10010208_73060 [Actinomadura livida]
MNKLQIGDLAPEDADVVELGDDDLDLIVGAMAPGSGFVCSVTSGDAIGKPAEECFRV